MATQTIAQPATDTTTRYRWTRAQYEQMVEAGVFDEDANVELIDGDIITMSPQNTRHATAIRLLQQALNVAYKSERVVVDVQLPLALGEASEPEPDLAVVAGSPRDYRNAHPSTALLVVEVADASLAKDRTVKGRLYAQHGIAEYWILNVAEETLEVHCDPAGDVYETKTTLHRGDTVTPPGTSVAIAMADVLP